LAFFRLERRRRRKTVLKHQPEVTIFPAETVKNSQTLPALSKMNKALSSASEMNYHTWCQSYKKNFFVADDKAK